jgi:hypothetical protein
MTNHQARLIGLAIVSVGAAILSLMQDDLAPVIGGITWGVSVIVFAIVCLRTAHMDSWPRDQK